MITNISPLCSVPVGQVVNRILGSGRITRADEKFFLRAMVTETVLSDEEMMQISNVYDRLQMDLLKVVD
jgi:hypothetical protein